MFFFSSCIIRLYWKSFLASDKILFTDSSAGLNLSPICSHLCAKWDCLDGKWSVESDLLIWQKFWRKIWSKLLLYMWVLKICCQRVDHSANCPVHELSNPRVDWLRLGVSATLCVIILLSGNGSKTSGTNGGIWWWGSVDSKAWVMVWLRFCQVPLFIWKFWLLCATASMSNSEQCFEAVQLSVTLVIGV